MSELKIIKAYLPSFDADHNDILLVSHTKENYVPAKQIEVYLKSEADRYIAELQSANQLEIDEWYNKLMHQKYKRCLDKAEWCESEEKRLEAISPMFDTNKECWEYGSDYWAKWHNRWRELAEQFKPNSTATKENNNG